MDDFDTLLEQDELLNNKLQKSETKIDNIKKKIDEIDINRYFETLPEGIMEDMTYDEYFELPAINCSALKYCQHSPYHMDEFLKGELKEEKKEYNFGNYFHCLVFEEEKFWKRCYIFPDPPDGKKLDRRLKAHKEFYEECIYEANGREIITKEDFEKMEKMRDALYKNNKRFYNKYNLDLINTKGYVETIFIWKNRDLGINCKCRVDKFVPEMAFIDLKTTKNAGEFYFKRDFDRYLYKMQAAFYMDAVLTLGFDFVPFLFIAQEHTKPYFPQIFEVSDEKINEGRTEYITKLKKYIDYKNNEIDIYDLVVI